MCYYNSQRVTRAEHIRLKQLEKEISKYDFLTRDMISGFEYSQNAVLKKIDDREDFDIVTMEWGFIPDAKAWPYMKTREEVKKWRSGFMDPRGKFQQLTLLNAVSEEILLPGKIYRDAALHRRCIVLSTGFFEWRHVFGTNKRTGQPLKTANKIPYYVTLKGKEWFPIAGIWNPWTDPSTGEYVESFAIVTTAANELMQQVHNSKKRMPTILTEELAYEWLLGNPDEKRISELAKFKYPSQDMEACTIAKDFRESIEPAKQFMYEDVPALELNFNAAGA